jgi:hypothetical protein
LPGTGEYVANYFKEKKAQGNSILTVTQNIIIENGTGQDGNAHDVIDVLVIGKEDIYIVKTQDTFSMNGSLREANEPLKMFFTQAESYVKKNIDVQNKRVKRLFVTDELSFIFF